MELENGASLMQAGIEIAQWVCNGGNLLGQAMCRIVWKWGWQMLRDLDNERRSIWMNKMCFLMFKKWVYFFILIWIWTGSQSNDFGMLLWNLNVG